LIHVCLSFDIWLLASKPNIGGFEGFDLTNPRGRFGGERFHLACSKLGLGDAILPHTILLQIYSVAGAGRERADQLRVSSKRGSPSIEGGFNLAEEKRFWEFQVLGFSCRGHSAIIGCFRGHSYGGLICIESGTISLRGGCIILWRVARSKGLAGIFPI
jgi:hypothetical protein